MFINEIFTSFQGEGPLIGTPATFLRVANCNLSCSFCDTDNSVSKDMSPQEVRDILIKEIEGNNIELLVITGGEPLLQFDEILEVISLLNKDINIQFETNGSIFKYNENFNYVISPKEDKKNVFKQWYQCKNIYFKFVISNEGDINEIIYLKEKYNYADTIWLQPEFSKHTECADLILNSLNKLKNIKLSVQSHKSLNQR
ncbi:MAG: 7-carboxy-7-deazaguanine synthase QueE [archaeon]|nr:7-carboxy-7-deazaguanine synthase QueE [archaeon]